MIVTGLSVKSTMRWPLIAAVMVTTGCHGPLDVRNDYHVPGGALWLTARDLAFDTTLYADTMARSWGGNLSDLDGWTVVYHSDQLPGGVTGQCNHSTFGGGTIDLLVDYDSVCIPDTALAHEVGHVIIDDHGHSDSRWRDHEFWLKMSRRLSDLALDDDTVCISMLLDGSSFVGRNIIYPQ